jgi:hypothetical protein
VKIKDGNSTNDQQVEQRRRENQTKEKVEFLERIHEITDEELNRSV